MTAVIFFSFDSPPPIWEICFSFLYTPKYLKFFKNVFFLEVSAEREKGKIMRFSIHFTSKCFFFVKTPPPHGPAYMESGFPHSFPLLIFTDKAWLWPWGWSSSWGTVVSTLGNRHAKCFQAETLCMLKTSQVYRLCFLYYPQMMLFCQKKPNSTMKSQKLWPGRTLLSA